MARTAAGRPRRLLAQAFVSASVILLAFAASGLSFTRFAALMAPPWLVAITAEYAVFRGFFATDLDAGAQAPPMALLARAATGGDHHAASAAPPIGSAERADDFPAPARRSATAPKWATTQAAGHSGGRGRS
jgi:hypothetical protein